MYVDILCVYIIKTNLNKWIVSVFYFSEINLGDVLVQAPKYNLVLLHQELQRCKSSWCQNPLYPD